MAIRQLSLFVENKPIVKYNANFFMCVNLKLAPSFSPQGGEF